MKFKTLLLTLPLLVLAAAYSSGQVTLYSDDFSGSTLAGKWGQNSIAGSGWFLNTTSENAQFDRASNNRSTLYSDDGSNVVSFDFSGYTEVTLEFSASTNRIGSNGDRGYVGIATNPSTINGQSGQAATLDGRYGSFVSLGLVQGVYSTNDAGSANTGTFGSFTNNTSVNTYSITWTSTSTIFSRNSSIVATSTDAGDLLDFNQSYGIFFFAQDSNITFDNVLLSAIPEPSSYALITAALGLAFVAIRRRRK